MRKVMDSKVSKGKAYRTPVLTRYDDIRTLTLGSSPLGEESGPGGVDFRVIGGFSAPRDTNAGESSNDIFEG